MRFYVRIPRHSQPPASLPTQAPTSHSQERAQNIKELKEKEEPKVDKEGLLEPNPNDPTENAYDVILCGTGLIQSILASALSRTGKTILHCDGNDFYGELDGTMNLKGILDWVEQSKKKEEGKTGKEGELDEQGTINLHPLGSLTNAMIHSYTDVASCSSSSNPSSSNGNEIKVGRNVSTPYGMGTVLSNSSDNSNKTLAVSLHDWVMADGSNPIAYFGSKDDSVKEVQPPPSPLEILLQKSRYFYFDLTPGLLYASANAVNGIVASGVGDYVEFKSILGLLLLTEDGSGGNIGGGGGERPSRRAVGSARRRVKKGKENDTNIDDGHNNEMNSSSSKLKIMRVPCSKGDVFSTKLLSPNEKRRLMKFLQLALDYAHATSSQYSEQQQQEEAQKNSSTNATAESSTTSLQEEQVTSLNERQLNQGRSLARPQNKSISKNDMNILLQCIHDGMDFDTYLKTKQKLDDRLRKIVIHALSLGSVVADSDSSTSSRKYDTERGMNDLCRHLVSLGRYGGTAFLCPLYGSGELSQSFCRSSAVHGGVYLLRRPAKQILTTCKKENDDDVESVYGILLGGDSMDDNDGINSFGYGVVEDKVIHGRNIIAANDSLFLHQKKILEKSTARRILRRISVVRGKLIPSSSGEQKNDISNGHDDENSQEQRYIIVMTPQTGTLKNESVIHGLAIDDSVFVSPTSSGAEDVYTVLHLTTSIECCTEEGKVVFDDAVLDQAVASLIESRQGSSDTVMEELYHVSFSYPDLDSDNKEEENEKIEAEAKINFIIPKGLHICHRPGQSITVDAAFREAERIFHDICPGAEFLARSEDIDKAVQERVGNNRVGDDDEGMMLESAMHMIGSVDDEQES